ncbi:MAG: AAA family ATPase [Byssovorax sp.]
MFTDVHLKSFAAFSDFHWAGHGQINVVVGENDTGKSHLLKVLYAIAKTVETNAARKAGNPDASPERHVFSNKLRWTFQPPNLVALIKNGEPSLHIDARLAGKKHHYTHKRFAGPEKWRSVVSGFSQEAGMTTNAIFLPPKEVLTIFAAIEISRGKYEIYGFDDTYYDLLKLLRVPPTQGDILPELLTIADGLDAFVGGQIVRKGLSDEFLFQRGEHAYTMPQTADGIKKIGILTNLIKNRSLTRDTILFLDEPETNLHPRAISVFTEMLFSLAQAGVQIYLATHSYFVLKKLEILAKRHQMSVPFCSLTRSGEDIEAQFSDMRDGMPENPIIDESLRLYEEGYNVDMQRSGK